jgi:hypothetical protein
MDSAPRSRSSLWIFLLLLLAPISAQAIPAFARKYQLRCTACHEAWPALNDFGRAFRDNGYQLQLGKDDPTTTPAGYWPIALRVTPHYERTSTNHQTTDQGSTTVTSGGRIGAVAFDLLTAGTLGHNVSFLFVPTVDDGEVSVESAWVRFDNLGGSPWMNLKIGHHEVDLPRSAHRPWSLSSGYLIYGYHPAGSASTYSLGDNQDGLEWVGHDRGSVNRAAVSIINVDGSPGSKGFFNTPGLYFHASHQWRFESEGLSAARVGIFGADTTWPTRFLTDNGEPIPDTGTGLKHSRRYGLEGQAWFGPTVTPLHVIAVVAHGADSRDLITDATRDGTYNGGFLEVAYTPTLHTTPFFRYDAVRNNNQALPDVPRNANDVSQFTVGIRHTLNYSTRAEYALHGEFSSLRTRGAAAGDSTVTANTIFLGVDFAF